jgi:membrane protein required for colicin V production
MILLARFLEGILKIGKLSQINQLAGSIFGGLKFALTVSVILAIFNPIDKRVKLVDDKTKKESLLYSPVINLSHLLFPALEDVKQEFEKVIPEPKEK